MKLLPVISATLIIFGTGVITGGMAVKHFSESVEMPAPVSHRVEPYPTVSIPPASIGFSNQETESPTRPMQEGMRRPAPQGIRGHKPEEGRTHFTSRMNESLVRGRLQFIERTSRLLDLSEQQRSTIRDLLKESHHRMQAISAGIAPNVRDEIRKTHLALMAELTDSQKRRFLKITRERMERPQGGKLSRDTIDPPKYPPSKPVEKAPLIN
ncbi:hypothetical protein N9B94_04665 [Verrucomicrobia bacterium]|nr:hypothetical protein [Verrucomicrobiota bacterium]